mmetsp:Transcript_5729/g.10850  ORF Transcript_5729/g.10850 Transcript_5729/m.10850 type:complete len:288 (+) Transcript_5729:2876-3739(+)
MTTNPVVIWKLMNTTHSCKSMVLIINNLSSGCLNVIHRNSINPTENLCRCHPPSIGKQLPSNIFCDIGISIKSHEHGRLQVHLGTLYLFYRWTMNHPYKISHDIPHEIIQLIIRCHCIDTKESRVLITSIKRRNRMGQLMLCHLLTHFRCHILSKSRRTIIRPKHSLQKHQRKSILGSPRRSLKRQGNMSRIIRIKPHPHITPRKHRRIHGNLHSTLGHSRQSSKMLLCQLTQLTMIHSPRSGNHHPRRRIMRLNIIHQIITRQGTNILLRSKNRPPKPRPLKRRRM